MASLANEENNWEAIDIYLFSNGHVHLPPRKYHLRAEDIDKWDTYIKNIATLQYGSSHPPLSLYSLDGRLIQSPLELKNNMAYVAVQHSDDFIKAGYEKYLMKASRSIEKRLTKLSSIDDGSLPGILKTDTPRAEKPSLFTASTIKAPELNFTSHSDIGSKLLNTNYGLNAECSSVPLQSNATSGNKCRIICRWETNNDTVVIPKKLQSPIEKTTTNIKAFDTSKRLITSSRNPPEKEVFKPAKKLFVSSFKTGVRRSNSSKQPSKLLLKRTAAHNQPIGSTTSDINTIKANQPSPKGGKSANLVSMVDQRNSSTVKKHHPPLATKYRQSRTNAARLQNVLYDEELPLISNNLNAKMDKQRQGESNPSRFESDRVTTTIPVTDIVQTSEIKNVVKYTQYPNTSEKNIETPSDFEPCVYSLRQCSQQVLADNNVMEIIDKDNLIQLKLNIEILKPGCQKSSSMTNILKGCPMTPEEHKVFRTKSMESLTFNKNERDMVQCYPKAKIIHCLYNNSVPEGINKEPSTMLYEMLNHENGRLIPHDSFNLHAVKKAISITSLETLNNKNTDTLNPQKEETAAKKQGDERKVADSIIATNKHKESIKEPKKELIPEQVHDIKGFDIKNPMNDKTEHRMQQELSKSKTAEIMMLAGQELNEEYNTKQLMVPKIIYFKDKATQTTWEGILLEVRQHEDGRYSFRIPPLSAVHDLANPDVQNDSSEYQKTMNE